MATAVTSVLIGTGLLVTGVATVVALRFLLRFSPRVSVAVAAGTVALQATLLLVPLHGQAVPAAPRSVRFWQLPTGSRLAYLHLPGTGERRRAEPVVVLHGGPGIPDLAGDAAFFGHITDMGYEVYVYAQLGSGPSTRLTDPRGYSVERDVADLEAIRHELGAARMLLVGHSYGATLAVHYLAAHPDRVSKLVLASPGALDPADDSGTRATERLALRQRLDTYAAVAAPRALLGYAVLQVNPTAAHAYLGDAEADTRNDRVLTAAASGLHCDTDRPRPGVHGSGFYRLQYPQSAAAPSPADIRPQLATLATPVLLFKGSCDYLSWRSAIEYRWLLPNTSLIYLAEAGHNLYSDQPTKVVACLRAFLVGDRLPIPPYSLDQQPQDYQQN